MTRSRLVRLAIFVATTVAAWAVLTLGYSDVQAVDLQVGQVADREYRALRSDSITDPDEFEAAMASAEASVDPIVQSRPDVESQVLDRIESFFSRVEGSVIDFEALEDAQASQEATSTTSTTEPTTTTTIADEDPTDSTVEDGSADTSTTTTPTTVPPSDVTVSGQLFVDADGDGLYQPEGPAEATPGAAVDAPLPMVSVLLASGGRQLRAESQSDGSFTIGAFAGEVVVTVDTNDPEYPQFLLTAGELTQTLECSSGETCEADWIGLAPALTSVEAATASVLSDSFVSESAIQTLVAVAREDAVRTAVGGPSHLFEVERTAIELAESLFVRRIFDGADDDVGGIGLEQAKTLAVQQAPAIFYSDTPDRDQAATSAVGQVVSSFLQSNWAVDEDETATARAGAVAEVEAAEAAGTDYQRDIARDERLAQEGDVLTAFQVAAISETATSVLQRNQRDGGLLAVLAILSGVLAMYLTRFRPEFWAKPRMVALLGILIVLAAGAVRLTVYLEPNTGWYVMPAVLFGLMTTVLFDARIGVLMALSVAILCAVGTGDSGLTVYSLLSTMAPIGFVSAISTRRAFRNAAVYSAIAAGVIAAATSWFFHTAGQDNLAEVIGLSVAWAVGVSLLAALVGLAGLQFFESAFDITTTLTLLDLTDRNHDALQLLQEKAFGTFNHSLMVGTLADAAARAIGANPLLARASAYYHDLGKTEHPSLFIENQFGIGNPHDDMEPDESADVIRRHVTDGVKLAKKFAIPSEVAEAIVSHHGDAVMRYFYEKARQDNPGVDVSRYRHIGHKPRTAETAIVMLADSLEASCRAVFQHEEPTPDAIEKVVNRVIDEKVNDGQLSESPLTLAQLTEMRKAFLGSLVGHYHQRINYPNFPGS